MDRNIYWSVVIQNIVCIICWTALAIIFAKWWIALFSILSIASLRTNQKYCRVCDKCGKHSPYANNYNEALNKAKEAGWIHYSEDNKDYCPDCQQIMF